MDIYEMSDRGILAEVGRRIKLKRLNKNMSQLELARHSGTSRNSIYLLENGHGVTLLILIQILRSLNILEEINNFVPEVLVSPIQLAKLQGKRRQRASKTKK